MNYWRRWLIVIFCCFFHIHIHADNPPLTKSFGEEAPDFLERLKAHIKYNPNGPNTVGYIAVEDHSSQISQSTWLYIKKALEYYKEKKPAFIILKLNTPGGQIYPAQLISDALKDIDFNDNIPVISFIDDWAMSAGAMLAYSTRFITASSNGSMGAAEPVIQTAEGELKEASEKVNSAMRADFANRARYYNRNVYIAEKMVDKDLILVQRKGKIQLVDSDDQIIKTGPDKDILISPKGKLLTLDAVDLMKYGVGDLTLKPTKLTPITDEEKNKGAWPAEKMLLFQYPFLKEMPNTTIDAYTMDWKTQLFVFLASPVVSSLLFMGMLMSFYMEMNTPGFGVAGTLAVTFLFLIILSNLSLDIANWLEAILILVGLGFVLAEIFLVPSAGLLGIIGAALFLIGMFGMLLPNVELKKVHFDWDTNTFNAAGEYLLERIGWICGTLLLTLGLIAILSRYITPKTTLLRRFVLSGNEQNNKNGYVSGPERSQMPSKGASGIVVSALRPSGRVSVNDVVYQAMTAGTFIPEGSQVKVVGYDSGTLVVDTEQKEIPS